MIMHPCRPGRATERAGNLGVLESLLHTEQEYLALQSRQAQQSLLEQPSCFIRCQFPRRIGAVSDVVFLDLQEDSPLVLAEPVLEQVASDTKEPTTKRAIATPPIEPAERLEKRILNEIVNVGAGGSRGGEISTQCRRVTVDQLTGGALVPAAPSRHELWIGYPFRAH